MSFETICKQCEHLKACKELEARRVTEAVPLWVPLGWLFPCPDGFKEPILAVELQPLLERGKPKPGARRNLPQAQREQQIAALLADGPMQSREVARRIGLGIHTVNGILRQMHRRGELERELRQRYYWYALAA